MLHTIDTTYGPILFHFNLSFALLKLPFGSNKWTYEKYLYKFIFQSAISFHQIIRLEDEAKVQRWLSKHAIKKEMVTATLYISQGLLCTYPNSISGSSSSSQDDLSYPFPNQAYWYQCQNQIKEDWRNIRMEAAGMKIQY